MALAQTVRASGLRDPWVMSFDGDFMDRFEREAPEIKTGVLVHERPLFDNAIKGAKIGGVVGAVALTGALLAGAGALPAIGGLVAGVVGGAAAGYGLTMHNLRNRDLKREADVIIPGKRILSSKMVDKAHQLGKEIAVYTVDDSKKGAKFINWGVDALISNYPERHLR